MLAHETTSTWARAIAISLALHASFVAPWILLGRYAHHREASEKLLVELFGMIADRQTEERAPAPDEPRPAPPRPRVRARNEPKVLSSPDPSQLSTPDSPVTASESQQLPPAAQMAMGTASEGDTAIAPGDLQRQQTLQAAATDLDELRRYLATVQKKLQANLVYPEAAKKAGYEGTPVLGFTIMVDGTIKPGSLVLVESSGHEDLDGSALKAATASEPFDRPIRELKDVRVGVKFGMRN
jgi:protein TonB